MMEEDEDRVSDHSTSSSLMEESVIPSEVVPLILEPKELKKLLHTCNVQIHNLLDLETAFPYLVQEDLLTQGEMEKLCVLSLTSDDAKINYLVEKVLPKKGRTALPRFLKCLEYTANGTAHVELANFIKATACEQKKDDILRKVNNVSSTLNVATYMASKQPPPSGYCSPQLQLFGSFHSSSYSGLPTFPINLQLNPPVNNSRVSSGSSVIDQSLRHYHPLNESPHDNNIRKSPNTTPSFHNPTQMTSSTPTSPQTHMPANNIIPGRFQFPSISSPLTLPASLPSTSFNSLTTTLKSPTGTNTNSPATCISIPTAPSSSSLTTQPGAMASNITALTSSSYKVQDVNSPEYRKLIFETAQQWSKHKQKMKKGRTKCLRLKSPAMFCNESIQSPTSGDTANPGQPASSVNLSSSLSTVLVSSSTDTLGFNSHFIVTVNSENTSRESSSISTILGLSSPKLLIAGPPEIFADTLPPRHSSNAPSPLEFTSPSTTSMSVTPMFHKGIIQSPTIGDTANPGQPVSSVNLGPDSHTMLVSGSTDIPGFDSHFKITVSSANASREGSSTSVILGLGSPKLLTVGPSDSFANTLVPHPSSNAPSSLELTLPSTTTMSAPLMFRDGAIQSPTIGDTANPGQCSSSVNLGPSLNTMLVSGSTDTPGFNSHFKVAVSSANASRGDSSTNTIHSLGSPKLLTVGPPDSFANTRAPHPSSIAPFSLELTSPSTTTTLTSIPSMLCNGAVQSPTSDDTVTPGQPSSSVNLSPSFTKPYSSLVQAVPSSLELTCTSSSTTTMSVTTPSPDLELSSTTCSSITSSSVISSTVQMDDILTASYGCSTVAPSVVLDSSFMGDISSMSRSELEQLCKHNMEKLELQKKIISILEEQLKQVREQLKSFSTQKPTQSEVYKHFLPFVVEPKLIPDISSICSDKFGYGHLAKQPNHASTKPMLDFNEVVKGGTFDRPVLNEKYDFYANFGRS